MKPVSAAPIPQPWAGTPIEIVFSFDTTGSMSACLEQVRGQLSHVIERLNADIPELRIAVFAHGDYCDLVEYGYVTKHIDFTNDVTQLCGFVNEVGGTGGGDFEECYELVLREVREQLSWQPGTQKALVMIGDAMPHELGNPENRMNIDWREEAKILKDLGVSIYGVQCMNTCNPDSHAFFKELSASSGGKHLKLDELTSIVDMVMAVCYREKGAEYIGNYENEVRQREGPKICADLDRMFMTLKDGTPAKNAATTFGDVAPMETHGDDSSDDDEPANDVSSGSEAGTSGIEAPVILTPARRTKPRVTRPRSGSVSSRSSSSTGSVTKRGLKRKSKNEKTTAERALRERLAQKDFVLSPLRWSHWKEAISSEVSAEKGWRQRRGGAIGSRKSKLFEDMSKPAVYEIAVQTEEAKAKVPVLASVTGGFRKRSWERAFMAQGHLKGQVDQVLKRGCKLYVRRAQFEPSDLPNVYKKAKVSGDNTPVNGDISTDKAVKEMRGLVTKFCDYAWRKHYDSDSKAYVHRPLVKKGVVISE